MPLLKQFNDLGGIAYGLLSGLLIVLIGLIIVQYITTINPKNQAYSLIENSYVTKALYDNNVINIFFK